MELFNIDNPYYEKWKPGRPSKEARAKRNKYWRWEHFYSGQETQAKSLKCLNYSINSPIKPKTMKEKNAMRAFKFYSAEHYYVVSGKTEEEAKEYLFEYVGEMTIDKIEEIFESEWDEKFITMHEDGDTEKPEFKVSIREMIDQDSPIIIYSNDTSLID